MATVLPTETPEFAFYDDKEFNEYIMTLSTLQFNDLVWDGSPVVLSTGQEITDRDIMPVIAAGTNFGCGSSREQAVSTLAGHRLTIVAKSFARIFHQNAINLGLNIVECPDIEADLNDELEISSHKVTNLTTGREYDTIQLPKASQEILDGGGLIGYVRQRVLSQT